MLSELKQHWLIPKVTWGVAFILVTPATCSWTSAVRTQRNLQWPSVQRHNFAFAVDSVDWNTELRAFLASAFSLHLNCLWAVELLQARATQLAEYEPTVKSELPIKADLQILTLYFVSAPCSTAVERDKEDKATQLIPSWSNINRDTRRY